MHRGALVLGSVLFLLAIACVPAGEEVAGTKPMAKDAGGQPPSSTPSNPSGPPAPTMTEPTPSVPPADAGVTLPTNPGSSQPPPAPETEPADAGSPADTAGGPPAASGSYTCTLLFGINATAEWYNAGFETMVDNARWQLVRVHSGFVDKWADAASPFWGTAPTSACGANSKTPDRIIFVGLRFEWTDKAQWVQALTEVVKNLKAKYPSAKRIELASFVRGPGNKPCGSRPAYRSTIHPSQDEAIAEVVATDPGLLLASPKFEVDACSDFSGNPPHFSSAGGRVVAKKIAAHYSAK